MADDTEAIVRAVVDAGKGGGVCWSIPCAQPVLRQAGPERCEAMRPSSGHLLDMEQCRGTPSAFANTPFERPSAQDRLEQVRTPGTMMRAIAMLAGAVLLLLLGMATSHAGGRVALVIGNSAYRNAIPLPNPKNDAADVSAALKNIGFDVIVGIDLDKNGMDDAAIRFARAARGVDVALFYYSGHALQFAGLNYLLPVDAKLADEADLRRMIRVDEIISDLQQANNLRILVLDSCRDNPLADDLRRSIGLSRAASMQRGLAHIDVPHGMIVSYATQAGSTADDGWGRNSPYTAAFLRHIEAPHEIGDIFRDITAEVYQATNRHQIPELSLSLIGRFYLRGDKVTVATEPAIGTEDGWIGVEIKGSKTPVGAAVIRLFENGPAAQAGLKVGDVIVRIAGQTVTDIGDVPRLITPAAIGKPLRVSAFRQGQEQDLEVIPVALEQAAELNNADAMTALGNAYLQGARGRSKDPVVARKWFEKAAALGNELAMHRLGLLYQNGDGVAKNIGEARQWYEKAALLNDSFAMNQLGRLYEDGNGVLKDYATARSWFEKAAALNNAVAMRNLGNLFENGWGVAQNYAEAHKWYQKATELADAPAMNQLGLIYKNGKGVAKDHAEARRWFEKAAALNNALAMTNLGVMYTNGEGVAQDYTQARKWFGQAAALNNAAAMFNLGILYENGQGGPLDLVEARNWYEKAATLNSAEAMNRLGIFYRDGKGVAKTLLEARKWFNQAAVLNHPTAMMNLGLLYSTNGSDAGKDYLQALNWFEKAAALNQAGAMYQLGLFYENGLSVPKNRETAITWYRKAAERGDEEAKKALIRLGEATAQEANQNVQMDCSAFQKGADGSWQLMRSTMIKIGTNSINLNTSSGGITLRGPLPGGMDVQDTINRQCSHVAPSQAAHLYMAANWASNSQTVPACLARARQVVQNFPQAIPAGESVFAWFDGFTFMIRCTPQSMIFFAVVSPQDSTEERNKVAEGLFDRIVHGFSN
jgi:TPR repeat protein